MQGAAPKLKPFDQLAQEFNKIADSYKNAKTVEERIRLLATMRLIIEEADSLQKFHGAGYSDPSSKE